MRYELVWTVVEGREEILHPLREGFLEGFHGQNSGSIQWDGVFLLPRMWEGCLQLRVWGGDGGVGCR